MTTAVREDPRPARSRALLLDAATRLLERGGVDAVTVDAVTAESGVARATLYRNYATTVELIAAAFERLLPELDVRPLGDSLRTDLLHLVRTQAEFIDTVPLHPTMLGWLTLSKASDDSGTGRHVRALQDGIIERYRQPIVSVLTSHAARADLSAGTLTAPGLEVAVAELVGPLVFNRLVTANPNSRAVCTRIVDDFLRAHAR